MLKYWAKQCDSSVNTPCPRLFVWRTFDFASEIAQARKRYWQILGGFDPVPNIWRPASPRTMQNSNYFRLKQAYNSGSQALLCAATFYVRYDQLK